MFLTTSVGHVVGLAVVVVAVGPSDSWESSLPGLTPRPEIEVQLLNDAADGRFDDFTLLDAVLVAEGEHDPAQRRRVELALQQRLGDPRPKTEKDRQPAANRLYLHLHERVLTGSYVDDASQLRRVLDDGCFNCLSATVFFLALADVHDLPVLPVAVRGHVYGRLSEGGSWVDVQTTCPQWEQAIAAPAAATPDDENRRNLTRPELVGKAFYNRGVRLLAQEQFAAAVLAFSASVQLDPQDAAARENLLAAVNNWALATADAGRLEEAAQRVQVGLRRDPHYGPLRENDLHLHQRWLAKLCQDGEYAQAIRLLNEGFARRPEARLYAEGRSLVYRHWAEALLERGAVDEALAVCLQARHEVADRAAELQEQQTALLHDRALRWLQNGRAAEAQALLRRAATALPDISESIEDEKLKALEE